MVLEGGPDNLKQTLVPKLILQSDKHLYTDFNKNFEREATFDLSTGRLIGSL